MTLPAPSKEVLAFIRGYTSADRWRIQFDWNGKHGKEFSDPNMEFRNAVVSALGEFDVPAPLELVRDVYDEETSCSREAWCAYPRLWVLGQTLLTQGQENCVLDYFRGKVKSFDTEIACGGIELPRELAIRLASHLEAIAANGGEDRELCLYGAQYLRELADPPPPKIPSPPISAARKTWWRFW